SVYSTTSSARGRRDFEAEGFCGLEVDHQLVLRRRLHPKIGGLRISAGREPRTGNALNRGGSPGRLRRAPRYPTEMLAAPRWEEILRDNSASFCLGVLRFSVANLDAGPVPNPAIPVPNEGASGPVACWLNVDRSGRYIDGSWAGYRGSKQRTHCQAADNAGRYLATPCDRSPRCTRQTKNACDQQTDQKFSHFEAPPRTNIIVVMCVYAKFMGEWRPERGCNGCPPSGR